jgi:hypothetical protein
MLLYFDTFEVDAYNLSGEIQQPIYGGTSCQKSSTL